LDLTSILEAIQLVGIYISVACLIAAFMLFVLQRGRQRKPEAEAQKQTNATPLFLNLPDERSVRVMINVVGKKGKGYILDITPMEAHYSSNNHTKAREENTSSNKEEKEPKKLVFKWEDDEG